MAWIALTVAGILEVVWAVGLKFTEGFTKPFPSLLTIGAMAGSLYLLALAVRSLPLGTAYAVWTGIGTLGTVIIGMAFLGESRDLARIFCLALIVGGILGLKLVVPER